MLTVLFSRVAAEFCRVFSEMKCAVEAQRQLLDLGPMTLRTVCEKCNLSRVEAVEMQPAHSPGAALAVAAAALPHEQGNAAVPGNA